MNDTNYNTTKHFCVELGNDEFADVSYLSKADCISLDIGDKDDEDNSYGVFLTKRETRQLIHALHDAVREAKKHENI